MYCYYCYVSWTVPLKLFLIFFVSHSLYLLSSLLYYCCIATASGECTDDYSYTIANGLLP